MPSLAFGMLDVLGHLMPSSLGSPTSAPGSGAAGWQPFCCLCVIRHQEKLWRHGGGNPFRRECSEWHIQPHRLPANPPQTGDPQKSATVDQSRLCLQGPQMSLAQVRWKKTKHSHRVHSSEGKLLKVRQDTQQLEPPTEHPLHLEEQSDPV